MGPFYLVLQSSVPESDKACHWKAVAADLGSTGSRATYAGVTWFGDHAAVVEVLQIPTGCDLDPLCHALDHFRRSEFETVRPACDDREKLPSLLEDVLRTKPR